MPLTGGVKNAPIPYPPSTKHHIPTPPNPNPDILPALPPYSHRSRRPHQQAPKHMYQMYGAPIHTALAIQNRSICALQHSPFPTTTSLSQFVNRSRRSYCGNMARISSSVSTISWTGSFFRSRSGEWYGSTWEWESECEGRKISVRVGGLLV